MIQHFQPAPCHVQFNTCEILLKPEYDMSLLWTSGITINNNKCSFYPQTPALHSIFEKTETKKKADLVYVREVDGMNHTEWRWGFLSL